MLLKRLSTRAAHAAKGGTFTHLCGIFCCNSRGRQIGLQVGEGWGRPCFLAERRLLLCVGEHAPCARCASCSGPIHQTAIGNRDIITNAGGRQGGGGGRCSGVQALLVVSSSDERLQGGTLPIGSSWRELRPASVAKCDLPTCVSAGLDAAADMSCRVRSAAASPRQPCPPSCSHRAAAPSQRTLHHAHLTTRSTRSISSIRCGGSRRRRMQHVCRVAEGDIGDVLGIAGYLAGTAFFGLWFVEQSRRSDAEVQLALCRSQLDDLRAEVGCMQRLWMLDPCGGWHAWWGARMRTVLWLPAAHMLGVDSCWMPPVGWCPWLWISVDNRLRHIHAASPWALGSS